MKFLISFAVLSILFIIPQVWALSEDEYASMAAENLRMMHEAKGDAQAMAKASEDFIKQFSSNQIQEYIAMVSQIMQDKIMARRISTKIIGLLKKMGYRVHTTSQDDVNAIVIEE